MGSTPTLVSVLNFFKNITYTQPNAFQTASVHKLRKGSNPTVNLAIRMSCAVLLFTEYFEGLYLVSCLPSFQSVTQR